MLTYLANHSDMTQRSLMLCYWLLGGAFRDFQFTITIRMSRLIFVINWNALWIAKWVYLKFLDFDVKSATFSQEALKRYHPSIVVVPPIYLVTPTSGCIFRVHGYGISFNTTITTQQIHNLYTRRRDVEEALHSSSLNQYRSTKVTSRFPPHITTEDYVYPPHSHGILLQLRKELKGRG